jgi:antitoxin (DNA-binding transcriptional repressor) of toxin-antitoxin stability system
VKTVGIRELKAHLSTHLRDVSRGDVILVTDRGRVVAELRPPGAAERALSPEEIRYRKLVDRGVLRPAAAPGALPWAKPLRPLVARGAAQALLAAEREE